MSKEPKLLNPVLLPPLYETFFILSTVEILLKSTSMSRNILAQDSMRYKLKETERL